jgi:hypothetical protein
MSAFLLRALIATAALASSSPSRALPCSLINQGTSEARDSAGAVITLPAPRVSSCTGARILKGAVIACTITSRGRSMCQTYTAGATLTDAGLQRSGGGAGPWYTLRDIVRGSPGQITAVSRGRAVRSLPTGPVVLLEPVAIEPDFDNDAALRGISGIDVHEGGPDGPKVTTLSALGQRKLPTASLKSGQRYTWRVNPPPGTLPVTGQFLVLSEAERRQARAESERVRTQAGSDVAAQAVMWAGWLANRKCEHEAAQVLSRAGFDVD